MPINLPQLTLVALSLSFVACGPEPLGHRRPPTTDNTDHLPPDPTRAGPGATHGGGPGSLGGSNTNMNMMGTMTSTPAPMMMAQTYGIYLNSRTSLYGFDPVTKHTTKTAA